MATVLVLGLPAAVTIIYCCHIYDAVCQLWLRMTAGNRHVLCGCAKWQERLLFSSPFFVINWRITHNFVRVRMENSWVVFCRQTRIYTRRRFGAPQEGGGEGTRKEQEGGGRAFSVVESGSIGWACCCCCDVFLRGWVRFQRPMFPPVIPLLRFEEGRVCM